MTLQQFRKNSLFKTLKRVRVPKEAGDIDEKIVKEIVHFLGPLFEVGNIFSQRVECMQYHLADEPPLECRMLIEREINTRPCPQQTEEPPHLFLGSLKQLVGLRLVRAVEGEGFWAAPQIGV